MVTFYEAVIIDGLIENRHASVAGIQDVYNTLKGIDSIFSRIDTTRPEWTFYEVIMIEDGT